MGSELGVSDEKIEALANYSTSELYDDSERAALDELKLSFFVDQLATVPGIESYREKE